MLRMVILTTYIRHEKLMSVKWNINSSFLVSYTFFSSVVTACNTFITTPWNYLHTYHTKLCMELDHIQNARQYDTLNAMSILDIKSSNFNFNLMKNCATLLDGFTSERLVIKNLKTFLKLCSMLHIFWNNALCYSIVWFSCTSKDYWSVRQWGSRK